MDARGVRRISTRATHGNLNGYIMTLSAGGEAPVVTHRGFAVGGNPTILSIAATPACRSEGIMATAMPPPKP